MLGVPSELHLQAIVEEAERAGIRCVVFYEPDDDMGFTAACTQPVGAACRRVFRRLSLWSAPSSSKCERAPPPLFPLAKPTTSPPVPRRPGSEALTAGISKVHHSRAEAPLGETSE